MEDSACIIIAFKKRLFYLLLALKVVWKNVYYEMNARKRNNRRMQDGFKYIKWIYISMYRYDELS